MHPTVEAIVISYGSATVIEQLLSSLADLAPEVSIAIREHGPDGDPVRKLDHVAPLRVEHDPTNPGFGAGCNALAASSTANFLVFLNPDTELVSWPWSRTTPPPTGAVIGPVMTAQPEQHYGRSYRIRDEIALSWFRRRPPRPDGRGYVSGAALLIEREEFERIGGFDEQFFMYFEDIDLCLRANEAGLRTSIEGRWTMRHARGHSTDSRFAQALAWSYESALRFHAKWGSPVGVYRAYKVVDSLVRATTHVVRRTGRAHAYSSLARRAISG